MKDSDVRGRVLQFLYERRQTNDDVGFNLQGGSEIPTDIGMRDWLRACDQLGENGLIVWEPLRGASGEGLMCGVARINAFGVDVVEGEARSPIAVHLDYSQQIHVQGSQGVQIAGANSEQNQTITDAFERVIAAVDGATVSDAEKKEAQSLIARLLQSKALGAVLGASAQAVIAKLL